MKKFRKRNPPNVVVTLVHFFHKNSLNESHYWIFIYFLSPSDQKFAKEKTSIASETLGKKPEKKCPKKATQTH
jgi:hypothetical protein